MVRRRLSRRVTERGCNPCPCLQPAAAWRPGSSAHRRRTGVSRSRARRRTRSTLELTRQRTLNAAYGRDKVKGGKGNDAINVATAGPAARVNCGKGKDVVRSNFNERKRIRGCERRYSIR
jgi:hypothetical protein